MRSIKVGVDVCGFNYYELTLEEAVTKYKLNAIQRQMLVQWETLCLRDGAIVISQID